MDSKFVKAFIIGSSLPATIWTMCFAGLSHSQRPCPKDISYETFAVVMPVLFGLLNGIMINFDQQKLIYAGVSFGLLFAAYGTCLTNLHCHLYKIKPRYRFVAFIWEPIFYAFVWGIVIRSMNEMFGLYTY